MASRLNWELILTVSALFLISAALIGWGKFKVFKQSSLERTWQTTPHQVTNLKNITPPSSNSQK